MEYDLQFKIFNDKKKAQYLKEHSEWYKYLNRGIDNYQDFESAFKKYNRDQQQNKLTSVIDTIDTVNTVFKIVN